MDVITKHNAAKATGEMGDNDEEDNTNTIINGEGPTDQNHRNVDKKVSSDKIVAGEAREALIPNPRGDHHVLSPPSSPRNSYDSSKSLRITGKNYQTQKEQINSVGARLESLTHCTYNSLAVKLKVVAVEDNYRLEMANEQLIAMLMVKTCSDQI